MDITFTTWKLTEYDSCHKISHSKSVLKEKTDYSLQYRELKSYLVAVKAPCPIRSDRQTTSLTLTTGAPYICTNRRGCEQHEYSFWPHRFTDCSVEVRLFGLPEMAREEGGSELIAHMCDIQESAGDNWIDEDAVKVVIHVQISYRPLDMKGCVCNFVKWQILLFISKVYCVRWRDNFRYALKNRRAIYFGRLRWKINWGQLQSKNNVALRQNPNPRSTWFNNPGDGKDPLNLIQ